MIIVEESIGLLIDLYVLFWVYIKKLSILQHNDVHDNQNVFSSCLFMYNTTDFVQRY